MMRNIFVSEKGRSVQKSRLFQTVLVAAMALGGLGVHAQAVDATAVAKHYAVLVHANYTDTLAGATALQQDVTAFTANPSVDTLTAARKAWLAARETYGQTEAFRFYAGPIDDKNGPEGRLNAWPLDEAYIDSVKGKPNAGIINNPKTTITKQRLAALNERGGEENIAAGWHAIEFLLWGQDFSATGPGDRSFEDFVDGKAPNAKRRREYLTVVTSMLVDDLTSLVKAWTPDTKNYRAKFEKAGPDALRRMLVGVGSLSRGELAGERIEVALASQNQEDEHSCFSDNTHRDIVANARGIENVWLGRYVRSDGTVLQGASLRDLVAAKDAAVAERTSTHVAASVKAAEAIPAPFDQAIMGADTAPGRTKVQAVATALKLQSKDFVDAANAIGIKKLTLADKE
jgi:putative iron-regulated protein